MSVKRQRIISTIIVLNTLTLTLQSTHALCSANLWVGAFMTFTRYCFVHSEQAERFEQSWAVTVPGPASVDQNLLSPGAGAEAWALALYTAHAQWKEKNQSGQEEETFHCNVIIHSYSFYQIVRLLIIEVWRVVEVHVLPVVPAAHIDPRPQVWPRVPTLLTSWPRPIALILLNLGQSP